MSQITIETIKNYLEKNDINNECELLTTEYKNSRTPLLLKCNQCGNTFERDWNHLQRNRFCCIECAHKQQGQKHKGKLKKSFEEIQKEIWEKDKYIIVGEYNNCSTATLCKCLQGHYFNFNYSNYKLGSSKCPYCKKIKILENKQNNPIIKNDFLTLKEFLRKQLKPWRNECLKASNYICDISNTYNDNLDVHHIINITIIIDEVLKELNLPLKSKYIDYSPEEILKIIELFKQKHTTDVGVVLSKKYHDLFHKIYGTSNNTKEQYEKFKYIIQNNLL